MQDPQEKQDREYEKSGLYPKDGKPFRLVALLMSLLTVVGLLAVAASLLNLWLL